MGSLSDTADLFERFMLIWTQAQALGPMGWVLGAVLGALFALVGLYFWIKRREIAYEKTELGRVNDQAGTVPASQVPEKPMQDGVDFVDANRNVANTGVKPKRPA